MPIRGSPTGNRSNATNWPRASPATSPRGGRSISASASRPSSRITCRASARSSSIPRTASSAWARRRRRKTLNPWLVNASRQHVTLRTGGSYFHHADSFALVRGGHLDLCVLGAFQVAENGDIANWSRSDNENAPAIGGAMDLAAGAKRIWAVMEHTTRTRRTPPAAPLHLPADREGRDGAGLHRARVLDVTRAGLRAGRQGRGPGSRRIAGADRGGDTLTRPSPACGRCGRELRLISLPLRERLAELPRAGRVGDPGEAAGRHLARGLHECAEDIARRALPPTLIRLTPAAARSATVSSRVAIGHHHVDAASSPPCTPVRIVSMSRRPGA